MLFSQEENKMELGSWFYLYARGIKTKTRTKIHGFETQKMIRTRV
jgi:hypothetical protein